MMNDKSRRYSSLRNTRLTDELRTSIAAQHNSIAAASGSTQTEVAVVQQTLSEVRSSPLEALAADEDGELDKTVRGLTEVMDALELSRSLLQELWSKTAAAETAKAIADSGSTNITFGTNYKGMQMGNNYGSTTWNAKD